jgi:hypothetical protein
MSGLYINEISFLQLIDSYWRVIGVCIDVLIVYFVESKWEDIFCLSNLFISTVVIEVTVGRLRGSERRLVFLSLNGAKTRVLFYKQFLYNGSNWTKKLVRYTGSLANIPPYRWKISSSSTKQC